MGGRLGAAVGGERGGGGLRRGQERDRRSMGKGKTVG